MIEFDFSLDGMVSMQLNHSDKISDWLMYDTMKIKSSVIDNLIRNPEKGMRLIQNFGFLVRKHVFITDKRVFLERWNTLCAAEVFAIIRKKIDKSLVDELNSYVWEICSKAEEELFEAYQDQRIDPTRRQVEIKNSTVTPFEYYINFKNKVDLIKILKERYPKGSGVQCAKMIIALKEIGILTIPEINQSLFNAIKLEWGIDKFNEWGVSKKLKEYWAVIDSKWIDSHKSKIEYSTDIIIEIDFLRTKIKEIEIKK